MRPESEAQVLGVLGGMGPDATADFLVRVVRLTPAKSDQDHVPMLVYSDPSTPDRSDSILRSGPSPLAAMRRGIDFLNESGCSLIAIPCNSAHYWYDDLVAASAAPIPHVVDVTAEQLRCANGDVRSVGVLATDGTLHSGVYAHRLASLGMAASDLSDLGEASPVMRGIRSFKAGDLDAGRADLMTGCRELLDRGAEALIFGCTDISAALSDVTSVDGAPVVDASECLARASLGGLGINPLPPTSVKV